MSKIWEIDGFFYHSEKTAMRAASSYTVRAPKVNVYTVTQTYNTTTDFISEFQRDKQLRTVLGELTPKEIKELKFKSHLKELISVMEKIDFPIRYINTLKENADKHSVINNFIKENKVDFLSKSNDVEYYKALIRLTGFSKLSKKVYERQYFHWKSDKLKPAYPGANYGIRRVEQINLDESYHKAFTQAKKELLKENK